MGERVLGIDVGTSALKVILLDSSGRTVDEIGVDYEVRIPQPGWTEQDPADWWSAACRALQALWDRRHVPADIAAVGLTGQMHSLVLLDGEGVPVAPAILWSDQRTASECRQIEDRIGAPQLVHLTGNRALPGFTAPKLLWVRRHWPHAYDRARSMLLPKDFVRHMLTGVRMTDASDASGTLLFDVRRRAWSEPVLQALQLEAAMLPQVVEGTARTGAVSAAGAQQTGLRVGTPVIAGGSDNAAAAVGLNVVDPGVMMLSIGTSGVVFAPLHAYPERTDGTVHAFCHALPERWHLMGVTLSAGGSLSWLRDALQPTGASEIADEYGALVSEAALAPPGSEGLIFLPYLTGERTPHADPDARGVFFGLHLGHRRPHLIRAVLEGVALSQRQSLDVLRAAGAQCTLVRGAGGGLASHLWRRILSDALELPIQTTEIPTGAARGAGVLAGLGIGLFTTTDVGIDWEQQPRQAPDPSRVTALQKSLAVYADVYTRLAPAFARDSKLIDG
ncbi:MAG: xylulokinase [Chloroflexota bacterium]